MWNILLYGLRKVGPEFKTKMEDVLQSRENSYSLHRPKNCHDIRIHFTRSRCLPDLGVGFSATSRLTAMGAPSMGANL
ncbi:hypothetical protein Cenrod_0087 [Candidatus Symbiobacter mobilis CR]|uniref:Uncharacterized protein n=1 Tax=Candidatus Symbiobacter mobilis CR TaxID=946483 RepID=U5N409_9BURK|nr:hypothetical protein Cenrod_0087 [Candidatus Symbiobacter mobilis CR]